MGSIIRSMDWIALLGVYGVLMTLVFGFGTLLHSLVKKDVQSTLGQWLGVQVEHAPVAWVQATNRAFLHLFDRLFGGRGTSLERSVWAWLLLSPMVLLLLRITLATFNATGQTTVDYLEFAMVLSLSGALGMRIGRDAANSHVARGAIVRVADFFDIAITLNVVLTISRSVAAMIGAVIAFGIGGVFLMTRAIQTPYPAVVGPFPMLASQLLLSVLGGISIGAVLGTLVVIGSRISVLAISIFIFSIFMVFNGVAALLAGSFIDAYFGSNVAVAIGISTGIGGGISTASGILIVMLSAGRQMPVHPLKALASSAIFIGVVSLVKPDAAGTFLEAVDADGLKILAFVAFNVFADGASLLETRWVLQRSVEAPLPGLLGWLVLDLILSAAIFLVLPAILWEFPAFLEAALFRGERPWLGILFWTTFSTSAVFYVFVLASLLVRPLSRTVVVGRYLDVQARPVLAITFAFAVATTVLYWGAAFGTMAYRTMAQ